MSFITEVVSKDPFLFGETPYWDSRDKKLYVVDCFDLSFSSFDPLTQQLVKKHVKVPSEPPVEYLWWSIPCQTKGQFAVGTSEGQILQYDWEKEEVTKVLFDLKRSKGLENAHLRCLEDAKCDDNGRLWVGSMQIIDMGSLKVQNDQGCIHCISKTEDKANLQMSTLTSGYDCPNGLGWNKQNTKMFYADLLKRVINVYDFDLESATIENHKILFEFKDYPELEKGMPDGIAIDMDGNLYIACWKAGAVVKVDTTTGKLIEKIDLPVTNTTCLCFGGDDFSSLFLTTTSKDLDKTSVVNQPEAGKLFRITNPSDNRFKGFQQGFFNI